MVYFNLKPINKKNTAQEQAYFQLKKAILNGDIPNQDFFSEYQLTKSLGISRTPIRGATQDLVQEGLLISIPQKGFSVRQITKQEQDEIFMLRNSIEVEVINQLVDVITNEGLEVLEGIIEKQKKAMEKEDNIEFIDLDQEFHLTLSNLAGFEIVQGILNKLHNLTQLMGLKAVRRIGRMESVLHEHFNVLKALKNKDANVASDALSKHLKRTQETLFIVDINNSTQ